MPVPKQQSFASLLHSPEIYMAVVYCYMCSRLQRNNIINNFCTTLGVKLHVLPDSLGFIARYKLNNNLFEKIVFYIARGKSF